MPWITEVSYFALFLLTPIPGFAFFFLQLSRPEFTFSVTVTGSCLSSEPLTASEGELSLFSSNMPYFRHVCIEFYPLLFPHTQHMLGDFLLCCSVVSRISLKTLRKNSVVVAGSLAPREARGRASPAAIRLFCCRTPLGPRHRRVPLGRYC